MTAIGVVAVAVVLAFVMSPDRRAAAEVELKAKGADLCFQCHSDLKQKFTGKYIHTGVVPASVEFEN